MTPASTLRVAMLTREYPPQVYGGAGVHVTELVRHLRASCTVDVHCMGVPRATAAAYVPDPGLDGANPALRMLSTQLRMANAAGAADVVHSHTWYAGLAGHIARQLYGIPHVLTAHSLEPLRPWKAEQLGGGYGLSTWSEHNAVTHADAVIAVSQAMRRDILRVYPQLDPDRVHMVHNGIDTQVWYPDHNPELLPSLGIAAGRPAAVFVGRITKQKGINHLLRAAHDFDPAIALVVCADTADTPALEAEVAAGISELQASRTGVVWLRDQVSLTFRRQLLTAATVFACPSIYEPLGIVNLEAMACATAVVASNAGGIPEVVTDHSTGRLVAYDPDRPGAFERDFASAVNEVATNSAAANQLGHAGRDRAATSFTWPGAAAATRDIYRRASAN